MWYFAAFWRNKRWWLLEQVCSSGFLRRRPRRLELSTSSPPTALLAHYGLCVIALYKFAFDIDILYSRCSNLWLWDVDISLSVITQRNSDGWIWGSERRHQFLEFRWQRSMGRQRNLKAYHSELQLCSIRQMVNGRYVSDLVSKSWTSKCWQQSRQHQILAEEYWEMTRCWEFEFSSSILLCIFQSIVYTIRYDTIVCI